MKKGLAFALLLAFMLAACEKFERRVYVNEDALCCGVADPMNNIPWLKDFGAKAQNKVNSGESYFEMSYLLFANDSTGDNMIVHINHIPKRVTWVEVYDCNGNIMIGSGHYSLDAIKDDINTKESPFPCDSCYQFFETHTFVDTLAAYEYNVLN